MPTFVNKELGIDVEIVSLKQKHAVKYWEALTEAQYKDATGPSQWNAILQSAKKAGWFVDDSLDPMEMSVSAARFLAEELASYLLEQSQIPEV
jgi:hypothetical protein